MDDLVLVEVDEGVDYLLQIVHNLHFDQPLPALDQLVQSLVRAQLQQNVHVLVVLEHVLEFHDVVMRQRFVDFYLSYQLRGGIATFCLARERFSELFAIILAADTFLFYRLVT